MAQAVESGFVSVHTLAFEKLDGLYTLCGQIACRGNIVVTVDKTLEIVEQGDDDLVQTAEYSYNAHVRGWCNFMRNDNAHSYAGHGDSHHRHDLDWRTEAPTTAGPTWVGAANWPTLGDFLDAVADWYWAHREELPEPDAFPPISCDVR